MPSVPTIPQNAPFNAAQRAWLNGFFAGLAGNDAATAQARQNGTADDTAPPAEPEKKTWRDVDDEDIDYDWHDPALSIDERMTLAADEPLELRLMAATAQLDCGSCGYLCRSYSKAIADGEEPDLGKCVPGGKQTARMLKTLMKNAGDEAPAANGSPANHGQVELRANGQTVRDEVSPPHYSRDHPFPAPTLAVARLTGETSAKDVRFVSLSIAGSGMTYKAGDSLGVYPKNCYESVDALIRLTGFGGGELVPLPDGRTVTFREALIEWADIDNPSDALYELLASHASNEEAGLLRQAEAGEQVEGLVTEPRVIDVLARFNSARPSPVKLVEALDRLQPRLYSIASSPKQYPDEIHLCVGVVRYKQAGQNRKGVASTFLAERLASYEPVPAYVQPSHGFRPPDDRQTDIIMVGPGTGIAPFRAFLQERQAAEASGRNWLMFGDQHSATDFLFKDELHHFREAGVLTRLTTAFSRDQDEKIYVQHRMLEHGAELWQWLEGGACFYVCGDASRMAADVHAVLHAIASEHGGMTEAQAKAYIKRMSDEGRYQRDVY